LATRRRISVWQNGKELLSFTADFAMPDASSRGPKTRSFDLVGDEGIGSACLLHVLQEPQDRHRTSCGGGLAGFAQAGKETITLGNCCRITGLAALIER